MVAPGFKMPAFSASSTIDNATLSFTDPAGLKYSSFARIAAFSTPAFLAYLLIFTKGVFPISSNALSFTLLIILSSIYSFRFFFPYFSTRNYMILYYIRFHLKCQTLFYSFFPLCFLQPLITPKCRMPSKKLQWEIPHFCMCLQRSFYAGEMSLQTYFCF